MFKTDGSVITSKWKRKVDDVNISIDTGKWHHGAFITFLSTDPEYAIPDNNTYGSCLTTEQINFKTRSGLRRQIVMTQIFK